MTGVDSQMRQYERWFNRGCPSSGTVGCDGRQLPDLHVAMPPAAPAEEE